VRELAKSLQSHGFSAGEIHGDMDQSSRNAELQKFKDGVFNILCASDVAARGLDVKGVSHVFNFDTPWHPDDYVHRVGRTGRGGAFGRAFTLVTDEDAEAIANVEKLTGAPIPEMVLDLGKEEAPAARGDRRARSAGRPPREESPARQERPAREEAPREARAPRKERAPRAERAPRVEAAVVAEVSAPVERAPRAEAAPREDRAQRAERKRRADPRVEPTYREPDATSAPGEWNGPIPGFLNVSAL
jgi:superfamily II DNA/RNA helicase